MAPCRLTETEIVEGLRDPQQHDKILRCLYMDNGVWEDFNRFTGKNRWLFFFGKLIFLTKLLEEEKKEVYNDVWLKFDDRVKAADSEYQPGNWRGFFKQCTKVIWRDINRKNQKKITSHREINDLDLSIDPISEQDLDKNTSTELRQMFEVLGDTGRKGWEIYRLIIEGYGYPEIAQTLGASEDTIRQRKTACDKKFWKTYQIKLPPITHLRD